MRVYLIGLGLPAAALPHDMLTVFLSQGVSDKGIPHLTGKPSQASRALLAHRR